MNLFQKEKGITLIGLVVTIIILLVLATISILALTGENGLLKRVNQAKDETAIAQEQEIIDLAMADLTLNFQLNDLSATILKAAIDNYLSNGEVSVLDKGDGIFSVTFPSEREYEVISNGDITFIPRNAVARVGKQYYASLQDAIDAVPNNTQTNVILMKTVSENITIAQNKNVVLKLNRNTILNKSQEPIITVEGLLTVDHGDILGSYTESSIASILVENGSEVTLKDVSINRSSDSASTTWETIEIYGTAYIDSCDIQNAYTFAIRNYSTLKISGDTQISSYGACVYNTASGSTNITGGNLSSYQNNTIYNAGNLQISDTANIDNAADYPTIANLENAMAIISGGTISSPRNQAIFNQGTIEIRGTANINSYHVALYNDTIGTAVMTGGKLSSSNKYSVTNYGLFAMSSTAEIHNTSSSITFINHNEGTAKLLGGTIFPSSGDTYTLLNIGTLQISGTAQITNNSENFATIINTGSLTISGGSVINENSNGYAIYNNGGTAEHTGGTVSKKNF